MLEHLIFWAVVLGCLRLAYLIIAAPDIERGHIIRNNIAAQVEALRHHTDPEKVQTVARILSEINFDNVEPWQKKGLKDLIDHLTRKGNI